MKNQFIFLLIILFAISQTISVDENYHCNCVGCQRSTLVPGSQDWCRCCENAMVPICRPNNTTDSICQASVFDPQGCIKTGYLTEYCLGEESTTRVPEPSGPRPPTQSFPIPTFRPTETPPCNCVLCSSPDLVPGGWNWCRCCRVLFDSDNDTCRWHQSCDQTIFEKSGCLAEQWEDQCEWTIPFLESYNNDDQSPPSSFTNQVPCNCARCSVSTLPIGSSDWCRCCSNLYNTTCLPHSQCEKSVFDKNGCEANHWTDHCSTSSAVAHLQQDDHLLKPHEPLQNIDNKTNLNKTTPNNTTPNNTTPNKTTIVAIVVSIIILVVLGLGLLVGYLIVGKKPHETSIF